MISKPKSRSPNLELLIPRREKPMEANLHSAFRNNTFQTTLYQTIQYTTAGPNGHLVGVKWRSFQNSFLFSFFFLRENVLEILDLI